MRMYRWMGLSLCFFCSCGGETAPPQSPASSSADSARGVSAEKSATQPSYAPAPGSPPAADYAAPPPPAAAPVAPSAAEAAPSEHAEAPSTTDARARYSRANVQLSDARRELEIATGQRDCANACRALDSMERAATQLCELARSNDERKTCRSAQDQVGAARDRVHSACGECPKKSR